MAAARLLSRLMAATAALGASEPAQLPIPAHITTMTAFGYNASAQAGWTSWSKGMNLSQVLEGYSTFGLQGVFRIDCVGCPASFNRRWGMAHGIVCNPSTRLRMCSRRLGDGTDWQDQTLALLGRARPGFASGALVGIYLGDELTADGVTFADLEAWIDLVRGWLDGVAAEMPSRQPPILYYTESAFIGESQPLQLFVRTPACESDTFRCTLLRCELALAQGLGLTSPAI